MDKSAALAKFQSMLNQLVSEKIKKERPASEPAPESLDAKGEVLRKLVQPEAEQEMEVELPAPEGMEAELEVKPEDDMAESESEMEPEMEDSEQPELSPEIADLLAKILGQKKVKGMREISTDMPMKPKTVPVGGMTVSEITVVEPPKKSRKK